MCYGKANVFFALTRCEAIPLNVEDESEGLRNEALNEAFKDIFVFLEGTHHFVHSQHFFYLCAIIPALLFCLISCYFTDFLSPV